MFANLALDDFDSLKHLDRWPSVIPETELSRTGDTPALVDSATEQVARHALENLRREIRRTKSLLVSMGHIARRPSRNRSEFEWFAREWSARPRWTHEHVIAEVYTRALAAYEAGDVSQGIDLALAAEHYRALLVDVLRTGTTGCSCKPVA